MIPILSDVFPVVGNGTGGLSDAIECKVTNEVNGEYELRMRYPVTGIHYEDLANLKIIMATPGILSTAQPFRIYRITKPLNGVVTVYARHLAYDMSGIVITPCSAASLTEAMTVIPNHAVPSCPFTLQTTRTVASALTVGVPKTLWSLMGGSEGSFLDVYGGEWEFDGYDATLKTRLGTDRGVQVRYGKNLTQLENDATIASTYGGVYPFWYSDDEGLLTLTEGYIAIPSSPFSRILLMDFSGDFETKPTEQQLRDRTNAYITANSVGDPKNSWKISLINEDGILDQIQIGDTVKVKYEALGVDATARAVKTEWDVLADRYLSVTLGRVKQNLASILVGQNRETEKAIEQTKSALEVAIQNSTNFIKNGTGVMRFIYNSSGDLMEIVSLDNADITQAISVWRWNNGGFGHSSTGYNGAYTTAITQDGQIVADFITTGTMVANRVRAGLLEDEAGKFSVNLDTGAINMANATLTNGYITATYTQTLDYADYSQTDLDRIDDIRSGSVTPTSSDFDKYDINGSGTITALDRMYVAKMIQNSQSLTRTITTVIDPSANARTIQIRYQVEPDMGGTTPAIDRTYYISGSQSSLGALECDSLKIDTTMRMGGASDWVTLDWTDGLVFWDGNGNKTGTYPPNGLFKVLDLTPTINSQYFQISDAAITSDTPIFIENVYVSGSAYLNLTFTVQALTGSAYVYVRQASGTIPDNTQIHVKVLIVR